MLRMTREGCGLVMEGMLPVVGLPLSRLMPQQTRYQLQPCVSGRNRHLSERTNLYSEREVVIISNFKIPLLVSPIYAVQLVIYCPLTKPFLSWSPNGGHTAQETYLVKIISDCSRCIIADTSLDAKEKEVRSRSDTLVFTKDLSFLVF